jgi:hypothetical protein
LRADTCRSLGRTTLSYSRNVPSFQQLSAVILDSASDVESVDGACSELYELFGAAAASTGHCGHQVTRESRLESGLALSPALAAKCLLDGQRTRTFARGALNAINDAVRRNSPGIVEVLYAGTGPFAPLAFLIMPLTDPKVVRFTLLDVHAESTQSVSALVHALRLTDHVRAVICADATTYRHPTRLHVLISETMQRCLSEEPFVAILRNLRTQLAPGGVVVPERVTIELALVDAATEQARWNGAQEVSRNASYAGKVFEIDALHEWPAERTGTTIRVSCGDRHGAHWLALVTRVNVYQDEVLEPYASGLTTPEILWRLSPVRRDLTLAFRYNDGAAPRLEWHEVQLTPSTAGEIH